MTDYEFSSRTHISDGNQCEMALGVCEFVWFDLFVVWMLDTTFFRLAFLTLWKLRCNVRIDTLIFGLQFYWPNCDIAWLGARKIAIIARWRQKFSTHTCKHLIRKRKPPIELSLYDGGWHNFRGVIIILHVFFFLPCLKL